MNSDYGRDANGEPLKGEPLLEFAKKQKGDTVLLSFSGKDSLVMWHYLLAHGFKVMPYYLDWIPDLSWVNESISYYEGYFGQHIIRLPHPHFWDYLNSFFYQPPERVAAIRSLDFPNYDFADVDNMIAAWKGLGEPFCAIGMRRNESLARRRMIEQMGSIGDGKRRFFYPVWDWSISDVVEYIKKMNVKLPADYWHWGNTNTTFIYRYMERIKTLYPEDWKKVLQWFPLIELEFFRYEVVSA